MTNKPGSDRSHRPATHRRLEVVKPMTNTHDGETRTPEQIAEYLFAIAGREIEAIEQLTARPPACTKSRPPRHVGDPDPGRGPRRTPVPPRHHREVQ